MQISKAEKYLGLARKAGKVVSGYQTCVHTISKGQIKLIIVAEDASDNTKKKFRVLCERHSVPFRIYGNSEDLSHITGLSGRGIFGITDNGFAEVIIKETEHDLTT